MRQWAQACHRQSMVLHVTGRAAQALADGRQGIRLAVQVLDSINPGTSEHAEATAQTATFMADLGEVASAAGQPAEQMALLDQAITRCGQSRDRAVRRALGTVLHNKATAMVNALMASVMSDTPPAVSPAAINSVAAQAVALRTELLDPGDRLTSWELANSLLLRSQITMLDPRQGQAAVDALADAWPLIETLGPAGADLRARAVPIGQVLADMQPEAVRRARARRRWPS
jgi:hypothetical protein